MGGVVKDKQLVDAVWSKSNSKDSNGEQNKVLESLQPHEHPQQLATTILESQFYKHLECIHIQYQQCHKNYLELAAIEANQIELCLVMEQGGVEDDHGLMEAWSKEGKEDEASLYGGLLVILKFDT
ncbi:hypothetical protein PIB30_073468 [Stylosanthes scabra]|uniref:Uncharacterized protein n=1 Tax=Stylosanthes scabra TaxID=79078 RepID=A0ABU6URT9_9FABA|nr:hypothetical protein [Stylosanthes scabra]